MQEKGKPDGRRQLAQAMARKVVATRENAERVKRPGRARPLRPPRPLRAQSGGS